MKIQPATIPADGAGKFAQTISYGRGEASALASAAFSALGLTAYMNSFS